MIVLVQMPFADLERPSLAIGLLKPQVERCGIRARAIYANVRFAKEVGLQRSRLPMAIWFTSLLGDWVFSGAAFPGFSPPDDAYLEACAKPFARFHRPLDPDPLVRGVIAELRCLRAAAPLFIDRLAMEIAELQPSIVACSSMFSQQVASLALLRRVRALDPSVVTLLGGANVEGEMGGAVLEAFPWVDAVCWGEGDDIVGRFCQTIETHGREALGSNLPAGILTRHLGSDATHRSRRPARATTLDLEALPIPDYDDYFAALSTLSPETRRLIRPALVAETSRGCWWAEKRPCTFCGLNRGVPSYRTKSWTRVLSELATLEERYGLHDIAMVDNVLPPQADHYLFQLAKQGAPYNIFYEIRVPLNRSRASLLAAAGVRHVEAGIEALHDRVLALINKGTTAASNLALLKHAEAYGITVGWHLLTGFPGEDDSWYQETADLLPLIHHLRPPADMHAMLLQRFSEYHTHARTYGLSPVPYTTYGSVYPCEDRVLDQLAFYFRDIAWPHDYPEVTRESEGTKSLGAALARWHSAYHGPTRPILACRRGQDGSLEIVDTRACAVSPRVRLTDIAAQILNEADDPTDTKSLVTSVRSQFPNARTEIIDRAFGELQDRCLLVSLSGQHVSLVIPERPPTVAFPGGSVCQKDFQCYLNYICAPTAGVSK